MVTMVKQTTDEERRIELRAFLFSCRARLSPADVGLPETTRRRVAGLRREEVAELAGVSSEWYRWLESGRPIRVSAPFLARLARALRLSASERSRLYHLALPDLYAAENAQRIVAPRLPLLSPIQSLDEVESVMSRLANAKEQFFSDRYAALQDVRPRIVNSWRRSLVLGADPKRQTVPEAARSDDDLRSARDMSKALLDAAAPTMLRLKELVADSGYAAVTADASGRILYMAADRRTLRTLSRIDFEPGGDLSETACGTNAVGTVLAEGRPIQVMGAENFYEGGCDLTCAAAPVRDPSTLEILGVLDVTAHYRRIHPEILTLVTEAALEVEERLVKVQGNP